MSNRLTKAELDAVISVAGDADAHATIESCYDDAKQEAAFAAFESGMEKLRRQLNRQLTPKERGA